VFGLAAYHDRAAPRPGLPVGVVAAGRTRVGWRTAGLALALVAFLTMPAGAAPAAAAATRTVVVSNGPRTLPRVALTFDDGVSPQNCRRILAILDARGIHATFFPLADAMRADPAFWRLVVASGDPIGDHTLTHPQMPTLTEAQQFDQIDIARRLAEAISGAPPLRVFRPPYGAYSAATLTAASAAGFSTVLLWDVSDRDTSPHGTVAEMLDAAESARNGSVILMHCGPNATPHLLGPLPDDLAARGLRPVTVPAMLGLDWTPASADPMPSTAEILGGLSPLPVESSGGLIVGPNGIGSMTFAPSAAPSSRPSSPPASTPPASASQPPASSATPAASAAAVLPAASASPAPSPEAAAPPSGSQVPPPDLPIALAAVLALVALAALVIVAIGLARSRRPSR